MFIDGCFWHACPVHGSAPKSNATWWAEKLRRNVERDRDTDARLTAAGWTVLRIWEHVPPEEATEIVVATVAEGRAALAPSNRGSDRTTSAGSASDCGDDLIGQPEVR